MIKFIGSTNIACMNNSTLLNQEYLTFTTTSVHYQLDDLMINKYVYDKYLKPRSSSNTLSLAIIFINLKAER